MIYEMIEVFLLEYQNEGDDNGFLDLSKQIQTI